MLSIEDDDGRTAYLDNFAWTADVKPDTTQWSFYRDFGGVRLLAVDSRCSRVLEPDRRSMVDPGEWEWIRRHTVEASHSIRHLLLASTLPFLLEPGLHHLEGWDEALAEGGGASEWHGSARSSARPWISSTGRRSGDRSTI